MNIGFTGTTINSYLADSGDDKLVALYDYSNRVGVHRALIEFSARLCYNSLPRLGTAARFVENVLNKGHLSVSEHASYYVRVEQDIAPSGYLRPWLPYGNLNTLNLRNRFIDVNQNAVFGNVRALSEAIGATQTDRYSKVVSSVMNRDFPDMFSVSKDVYMIDYTSPNLYVPFENNVKLLSANFGSLTQVRIKTTDAKYKWARYTFLIENVSRNMTHQLVRHRGGSFSQESQRYVDSGKCNFIYPPSASEELRDKLKVEYENSLLKYKELRDAGMLKEDARYVLPSGIETRIVASFNYRDLLHFFRMRCDTHAQWEIRQVALQMLEQVYLATPHKTTKELEEIYKKWIGTK